MAFMSFWQYGLVAYDSSMVEPDYDNGVATYLLAVSVADVVRSYDMFVPGYYSNWFLRARIAGTSYIILGTTLLTLPALTLVCVYFAWLYPGHRAIHLACCSCTCTGYTQDFVDSYADRKVQESDVAIYVSPAPPAIIKVE